MNDFQHKLTTMRNGCLRGDRGVGKTYGLALCALRHGVDTPIVITSPTLRQSKEVLRLIEELCPHHKNVRCVPVSQLQEIKDSLLLVDEFDSIPNEFKDIITHYPDWIAVSSI